MNELEPGIKGYTQWRKALWRDDALREMARKGGRDPRVTAEVIALYGVNGRGCVIGTVKIAEMTGYDRHTIGDHRRLLIRLGWYDQTGKNNRCPVVDISSPVGVLDPPTGIAPVGALDPPTGRAQVGGSIAPVGVLDPPLSDSASSERASTLASSAKPSVPAEAGTANTASQAEPAAAREASAIATAEISRSEKPKQLAGDDFWADAANYPPIASL